MKRSMESDRQYLIYELYINKNVPSPSSARACVHLAKTIGTTVKIHITINANIDGKKSLVA